MITALGSINTDLVVRVESLARPGETVSGKDLQLYPGGKGANQAVAAARAGASVRMIGAVGQDAFADVAMRGLRAVGVDVEQIRVTTGPTGVALIAVEQSGQNCITVAPGANLSVRATWLEGNLSTGDILALQLEIPPSEVEAAIAGARASAARCCLNAAPAKALADSAYAALDYLVVNETEAAMIGARFHMGASPPDFASNAHARWGVATIVTLGAAGAISASAHGVVRAKAPSVAVIDTTGAGDGFVGALLAALDAGRGIARALKEGVAAGSLACTREGAQTSFPNFKEIQELADHVETI